MITEIAKHRSFGLLRLPTSSGRADAQVTLTHLTFVIQFLADEAFKLQTSTVKQSTRFPEALISSNYENRPLTTCSNHRQQEHHIRTKAYN